MASSATAARVRPSGQSSQVPAGITTPGTPTTRVRRPAPSSNRPAQLRTFITVLFLTTLLGTSYSNYTTSTDVLTFRSRLPSSTLTRHLSSSTTGSSTESLKAILPYFADKRNVINQYFTKQAWVWVTLAYIFYSLSILVFAPKPSKSAHKVQLNEPTLVQHFLTITRRFVLSTLYWYYLTQATWFGAIYRGPSLAKHLLLYSGAVCMPSTLSSTSSSLVEGNLQCTGQRGEYYRGGHDSSGHVFLMVHASIFLYYLINPSIQRVFNHSVPQKDVGLPERFVLYSILTFMGLCWFVLGCTSVFFHSPAEKMSGFLFGLGGWLFAGL
ncbi:BQ5605_C048g12373 [Microbotryum silenes-dioicae]|uniref:BQ5605_C048g12373 protein n=1 Tax=Microbotryum silenes-dioicae TaxID=796604 RepID=A0A2X0PHR3_9BASI|nr:BQ5605_C048g12373 [Microbotryum silenes-dioicae]